MNEKKVILFIVEGPSDRAALGPIMEEYFNSEDIKINNTIFGEGESRGYNN